MPPVRLGLVYAHAGVRRFLDAIGAPRTRQLFLTGEPVDAPTALSWGLVGEVVRADALQDRALALASEVASGAPLALAGTKRVIAALLAAEGTLPREEAAALEDLHARALRSEDFGEGVRAFAEKRPARWRGR